MHLYCEYINSENQSQWEELVQKNQAGGFHQSFAWANFKQSTNWDTYKIGVFQDGKILAGSVVLKFSFSNGTNFLYIPEGPILDLNNEDIGLWQWRLLEAAIHSIMSLAKNEHTTHLRIEPRITTAPHFLLNGFTKAPINLQPKHTQTLDLQQNIHELLIGMKQKCRYNIKLSAKNGVQVKEIPLSEIGTFYKLYQATLKRNEFDGQEIDFFEKVCQHCSGFSKLFVAYKDKLELASAIVTYYGERATYLYGASSDQHKQLMAPYALHWHIIQDAKDKEYKSYDFWGIAPDNKDQSHPWQGLSRFKKNLEGRN